MASSRVSVASNDPEKASTAPQTPTISPHILEAESSSTRVNGQSSLAPPLDGRQRRPVAPRGLGTENAAAQVSESINHRNGVRDRRKLTEEGYRSLSLVATFLAAVQAQLLSGPPASKAVSTFYYGGLIADILSAATCFLSARWFEMLNEEETNFLQQCWEANDRGETLRTEDTETLFIDQWVRFGIRGSFIMVWIGFTFLIAGVMCQVWSDQPRVVGIVCTALLCVLSLFIPPFMIKHSRRSVLSRLGIRRASGTS